MGPLCQLMGMGGGQSLLCAVGILDHVDLAGITDQAALLPQFLCATRATHLAGVCAGVGGGVSECAVVHWADNYRRGENGPVAGVYLLCAEFVSYFAAAFDWANVVAMH